jgi:hypothetical protein
VMLGIFPFISIPAMSKKTTGSSCPLTPTKRCLFSCKIYLLVSTYYGLSNLIWNTSFINHITITYDKFMIQNLQLYFSTAFYRILL